MWVWYKNFIIWKPKSEHLQKEKCFRVSHREIWGARMLGMQSPRNYAFIDSNNLHLGIQGEGWTLDYRKFRIYLREKYGALRAYLFIGYIQKNEGLYRFMEDCGYILIFKPASHDGERLKGNCDAELVLQAMIDLKHYHQAVLVTGDGDFACLVRYLVKERKLKRLIVPDRNRHSFLLHPFRSHTTFLSTMRDRLAYKK